LKEAARRLVYERPVYVAVVFMAIHLTVAVLAWDPVPHGGGDNTAYLALARSLLDYGRYLELWDPVRPPHTQYPPGFPAILAVAWTLGLQSWAGLKLMMLGFSALAVGLCYLWLRHRVDPLAAGVLVGILAVAPGLAVENQWVLSDVPFWAATLGSLLALERGRKGWGIALAFAALGIRLAGLPLVLALLVGLSLKREWRWATGVLAVLGGVSIAWMLRGGTLTAPYVSQLWLENPYVPALGTIDGAGLLDRIMANSERYGLRILAGTLTGFRGPVGAALGAAILGFAGLGFGRRLAGVATARSTPGQVRRLTEIFAVFYGGMILVWPEPWASDRFLIPLLPLILAYAAEGTAALPSRPLRRGVRWAGPIVILGLMVPTSAAVWSTAAECRTEARALGVLACRPADHQAFLGLALWTEGRLPPGAVVLSRKPRQWYWFSGYPGRTYPFSLEKARLMQDAREAGARYVVADDLDRTAQLYLLPAILEQQERFCMIQRFRRADASAGLLGITPPGWRPPAALEGDSTEAGSGLRLPLCPPSYRQATP
jgi:hypothetical protein